MFHGSYLPRYVGVGLNSSGRGAVLRIGLCAPQAGEMGRATLSCTKSLMKKTIGERFGMKLLLLICLIALTGQNSGAQQQGSGHPPRQQRPQPTRSPKDIPAIVKAANGSVVSIVMSDKDIPIAQGSGFFVSKDGLIVTNYHVIEEGSSAVVRLPDGASYVVDGVLASDKARDIAVIKTHGQNFRTLTLGNSDRVQVGEEVVAIGSPLSLESTVFIGIVSGIRVAEQPGRRFLQMTAPISAGSRGGPLFNMAGEVVGITTMKLEDGENLTFAIPANDVKRLLSNRSATLSNLPNEPEEAPQSETEQKIQ